MKKLEQYTGCLLGGAAGDALGYEIEFMDEASIFSRFGKDGISRYTLHNGVAQISDDTQMTLFTAAGLLCGAMGKDDRAIDSSYAGAIARCYQDWYRTQTASSSQPSGLNVSWLMNIPELYSRRAPGITCLNALSGGTAGTIDQPINNSKGCGGVMRVAPIGLFFEETDGSMVQIDLLGAEAAALTHGHPLGYIPAAAFVHLIHCLVHRPSMTLMDAVQDMQAEMGSLFAENSYLAPFLELMSLTVSLAQRRDVSDLDAIHQLGQGWVAEEALAIGLYCALKYSDDFEKALIASVNHSGDSDSTGSITGNLLGAYLGVQGIPPHYLEKLELKSVITQVATDLYTCHAYPDAVSRDSGWAEKYRFC